MGGALKGKAKETGAIMAIGGWDFIRENTEISFNKLADLSIYMHAEFYGDPDYENALAATTALYPKLQGGHKRTIDRAYKKGKKNAQNLLKDKEALAVALAKVDKTQAVDRVSTLNTPGKVAQDIVETHSQASVETAKLLSNPMEYEEASNEDSTDIAEAASANDSVELTLNAIEADYHDFMNLGNLKKYKKFGDRRIAVPVFRVAFVIQTKASAHSSAALSKEYGGISTSMTVTLGGIEQSLMQRITDEAYQDYLTRLRDSGFDVVPFEEMQKTKGYKQIKFHDGLYSKNANGTTYVVLTPTGMPLFWEFGNPLGNAGFGMGQPFNRISTATKSLVVFPTLVVNFAEMSSSGRSMLATKAEVGAEMGITLSKLTGQTMRIGDPVVSTAVKFLANPRLKEPLSIAGDFGVMVDGGSSDDRALVGLVSRGLGTALSSRVSESKVVEAVPASYAKLVTTVLATGNKMAVEALSDARDGKL